MPTRKSANRSPQGSSQLVREQESGGAAAAPAAPDAGSPEKPESQHELYEQAVRAFHSGNYAAAKSLFERAARGPMPEMAHSASLHVKICEKRLARPEMSLRTADEHYDYAVALMNEHRFEQAERHLLLALAQTPKADHLFYALALCRGLSGDLQGAYVNLKRAIELQPQNRTTAKNDPDFAEIGRQSPLYELIYSDSK
ncbi:MAG: TPR end-of-group domain-containing protein [Rhodospirillales bacterium]